ncbi:MAG: DUF3027 domain-containing protein [Planctomycetaceae bacterium]|nr:DUF3027 domain-containing protein [Planctomycetaceae bacterium]
MQVYSSPGYPLTLGIRSIIEFESTVQPLLGKVVTRPWKGYGSAIFIEIGDLLPEGPRDSLAGEHCIAIEWDWRLEDGSQIRTGSSNSGPEIISALAALCNTTISSVILSEPVSDLAVEFSNGFRLTSTTARSGDPEWSIRISRGNWLYLQSGQLHYDNGRAQASPEEERAFNVESQAAARWSSPITEQIAGNCHACCFFAPIDGHGSLLDYGVCTSSSSPYDGRAVNRASGCPAFVSHEKDA